MSQGKLYTSCFAKFKKGMGNKISIDRFNPNLIKINMRFTYQRIALQQNII